MGAKFVIIADNKLERTELIQMSDDGRGYQVHIPAYLISKEEADLIKETLALKEEHGVYVKASLTISNKDNNVVYELWSATAYDFIDWDI